jgi:hypothetical protein
MYCMMSEWIPLKERSKMVTLIWAGKERGEKYFLLKSFMICKYNFSLETGEKFRFARIVHYVHC